MGGFDPDHFHHLLWLGGRRQKRSAFPCAMAVNTATVAFNLATGRGNWKMSFTA
jgi:hypothetical protein